VSNAFRIQRENLGHFTLIQHATTLGLTTTGGSLRIHHFLVVSRGADHDKGKPFARGGRKATGPAGIAGLPNGTQDTDATLVEMGRPRDGGRPCGLFGFSGARSGRRGGCKRFPAPERDGSPLGGGTDPRSRGMAGHHGAAGDHRGCD